jgi:hypothetical protein
MTFETIADINAAKAKAISYLIKRCCESGMTQKETASKLGCSISFVSQQAQKYSVRFKNKGGKKKGSPAKNNIPITVLGQDFPSISAAERYHGASRRKILRMARETS